jgi:hypothetical protein
MNAMLRALLYVQWKAARWLLVPFVLLAFGAPLLVLGTARRYGLEGDELLSGALVTLQSRSLILFPALAALTGFVVALAAWQWDHKLGHVYALSLPVSRARYSLLRFAAGALLLGIPVAALWAGAFTAVLTTPIPEGLHAYPVAFGSRFLLASLIAYATSFALASGTTRTTLVIVTSLVAFLILGNIAVDVIERATGLHGLFRPIDLLHFALVRWPGPFHVFGGNWMLIDA